MNVGYDVRRRVFLRSAGFIALAALGVLLTAGGVSALVEDLAFSRHFHSADPCAGADRADLHAACLHTATAVVTSTSTEGRGSHVVRIALKGPDPIGGDVRLDDPPDVFYRLHHGDHVTVTVWSGTITAMTVHGRTHRTEDAPESNLLLDAALIVDGAAMSLGGAYMIWAWRFRPEELSADLRELKVTGNWVASQIVLTVLLGVLAGFGSLTLFLALWAVCSVPMSYCFWRKLRYG
ncbi:hypothetical protein [Streptomyces sp. NPDC001070]